MDGRAGRLQLFLVAFEDQDADAGRGVAKGFGRGHGQFVAVVGERQQHHLGLVLLLLRRLVARVDLLGGGSLLLARRRVAPDGALQVAAVGLADDADRVRSDDARIEIQILAGDVAAGVHVLEEL